MSLICFLTMHFLATGGQPTPSTPSSVSAADIQAVGVDVVLYSTRGDIRIHALSAVDLSHQWSFELGIGAHELICSPDSKWALGTAYGGPGSGHQPADHRIAVFNLVDKSLHRTIDLSPLSRPNDGAFIADGLHAYITVESPARIVKLNAESGEFSQIELDRKANHMLALSPDGSRL